VSDRLPKAVSQRPDLLRFAVGAAAAVAFSTALVWSESPPATPQEAVAMLAGSLLFGGLAYVAAARSDMALTFLRFWELPTWRLLQLGVHLSAAVTAGLVWDFAVWFALGRLHF
jgi:hypothetical protein